ncbi:pyruvate dehydrogenase [Pelagophyceae sp. CCMP2097]|nr:pyruvate dehydrogenase [Pelagophyceae sp. CCMP2097]
MVVGLRAVALVGCAGALVSHRVPRPTTLRRAAPVVDAPARVEVPEDGAPMRPRPTDIGWDFARATLGEEFGLSEATLAKYDVVSEADQLKGYEMMQLCRQFENACAQSYMQGFIRGFMHLDNGQESIPAFVGDAIKNGDIKYSYYREHTHALASGVPADKIMAELFAKDGGTCRGTGGSMHVYDKDTHFQGGWALVAEQLPYAVGAARSIKLDRELGRTKSVADGGDDDRLAIVFVGEGGAQNGRMAECLNAAAKEKLPILFLVIDNGRAINTFTMDVAQNSEVWTQGRHYGVPGVKVEGQEMKDVLRTGRAVTDYIRKTSGPAIMQVHTYRLTGHSPADPEHERGRKAEKKWAKDEADPLKIFEAAGVVAEDVLAEAKARAGAVVKAAVEFAKASPPPPASLAKELEYPDPAGTDYNLRPAPAGAEAVTLATVDPVALAACEARIKMLQDAPGLNIGDAINLAILEEMVRDPYTTIHAEDLQAGSSYDIPRMTQQTFGALRAADEIIDEGHFIGKAIGEGMNGYRPIVELMNANFGIYGMAELSSAGNTYATTGGQFKMPMTVVGAGGTAPNQALGAEHSQPFHAYVMGIPGLKICTAATPDAAYGLMKSMIRDDGPGMLFVPVKLMKDEKVKIDVGVCMPLNKAHVYHEADPQAVKDGTAVTVVTYLHGVRESKYALEAIHAAGHEVELIELRSLKPLDLETIKKSLQKTHKLVILDESTSSGGVGATVSALVNEQLYDELDAPVRRLCMDDAPVPYASSMEKAVVKRAEDLVIAVADLVNYRV